MSNLITVMFAMFLFLIVASTIGMLMDKKIGALYNTVPMVFCVSGLIISVFVTPEKEPFWRLKPCMVQTPMENLIGFSDYRRHLINQDFRQYRCN